LTATAEAAEDNNERESNVAMVTAANDGSNSTSGSGGNDDNGSGKKITIN
jgi:hypothetical protein